MAQYRLSAQIIGRSAGRSAVAAAAYRAGERLVDERTGRLHDYAHRRGMDAEILAPPGAPAWAMDRGALWNRVEAREDRPDATLAREIQLSIPVELSPSQGRALVDGWVAERLVGAGMVVDRAIHRDREGNPHAHLMATMRPLAGGEFLNKERSWNDRALLREWRASWADHCNRALERAGRDERVDHRSYAARGLAVAPTIHEGPRVRALEARGIATERGGHNRAVAAYNAPILALARALAERGAALADRERVARALGRALALEARRAAVVAGIAGVGARLGAAAARIGGLAGVAAGRGRRRADVAPPPRDPGEAGGTSLWKAPGPPARRHKPEVPRAGDVEAALAEIWRRSAELDPYDAAVAAVAAAVQARALAASADLADAEDALWPGAAPLAAGSVRRPIAHPAPTRPMAAGSPSPVPGPAPGPAPVGQRAAREVPIPPAPPAPAVSRPGSGAGVAVPLPATGAGGGAAPASHPPRGGSGPPPPSREEGARRRREEREAERAAKQRAREEEALAAGRQAAALARYRQVAGTGTQAERDHWAAYRLEDASRRYGDLPAIAEAINAGSEGLRRRYAALGVDYGMLVARRAVYERHARSHTRLGPEGTLRAVAGSLAVLGPGVAGTEEIAAVLAAGTADLAAMRRGARGGAPQSPAAAAAHLAIAAEATAAQAALMAPRQPGAGDRPGDRDRDRREGTSGPARGH